MQISLGVMVLIIIVLTLVYLLATKLYLNKKNKKENHYKTVVDNSVNIVFFSDSKQIIEANSMFFNYFTKYKTIEDFSKEHDCICEFFQEEEGCLSGFDSGFDLLEYLLKSQKPKEKVKMKIDDKVYYFLLHASVIDEIDGISVRVLSDITELEKTRKELEASTLKDGLTEIGNRRFFNDRLIEHVVLSQRYMHPFSLVLFDIDFFKVINDKYGHDVGDKVLISYTKLITSLLRSGDIFCRIGGEEFALILPYTPKDKAYILAQKLRKSVEELKEIRPITMSFGIIEYEKGDDRYSLYKRADNALYEAKESGRNRVVLG